MHEIKVIDLERMRNRHGVYRDRNDAGAVLAELLAELLAESQESTNGIVLAIPSGGVPVGIQISNRLNLPLDLLITRKLQVPGNTEAGFGAVTMGGQVFYNEELLARLRLSQAEIDSEIDKVRLELERRNRAFRNGRQMPALSDKTVIIADDGLASGYTMMAAISMVADHGPKEVIIAVPTAPLSSIRRVQSQADRIYCPNIQDYGSFAVAAAFEQWRDLDQVEVMEMLQQQASFFNIDRL